MKLNPVSNHIIPFNRAEHIAHRNFTPIKALSDACLIRPDIKGLPFARLATA